MENKNEDSLGRSLKKKCVVADSEDEKDDDVHVYEKINKNAIASNIPHRNNENSKITVVDNGSSSLGSSSMEKNSDKNECEKNNMDTVANVEKISDNCDFAGQNDLNLELNIYKRTTPESVTIDNVENVKSTGKTRFSVENRLTKDGKIDIAIKNVTTKVKNSTNEKTEHANEVKNDDDKGGGIKRRTIASCLDPVELSLPASSIKSRRKSDVDDTSTSSDDSQKQASVLSTKSFGDLDLNDDAETNDSTIDSKSQDSKSFASKVKQISENLQGTKLGDDFDERLNNSGKMNINSIKEKNITLTEDSDERLNNSKKMHVKSVDKEKTLTINDDPDERRNSSTKMNVNSINNEKAETSLSSDKTLTNELAVEHDSVSFTNKSFSTNGAIKKDSCATKRELCSKNEEKKKSLLANSASKNLNSVKLEKKVSNDKNYKKKDDNTKKLNQNSDGEDKEDLESECYPETDDGTLMKAISRRLKIKPLSFTSPYEKKPKSFKEIESTKNEDERVRLELKRELPPENGIQKILGKQMLCGNTQYLFRWVDKSGLHWETEEFLKKTCPSLIEKYENDRALEREQHVRYVKSRKRSRQRFNM